MMIAAAPPPQAPAAQTAPQSTAASPAQQQAAAVQALLKQQGMTDAGIAIVLRSDSQTAAAQGQLKANADALNRDVMAALQAPQVDVNAIGALLRRRDALVASSNSIRTDDIVRRLTALSPADRKVYLRVLNSQGQQRAAAPAGRAPTAAPAPPPRR